MPHSSKLMLLMLCFVACTHAWADEDDVFAPGLAASVNIERVHSDFAYATGDHAADVIRYAVVLSQPLATDTDFGIEGGYLLADIASPALAGMENTAGYTLGLSANWHPRLGNYLGFELRGGYRWNEAEFGAMPRQAEVTWYQAQVAAGPVLYLYRWRVAMGLHWQHDDGHEDDMGTSPARQGFSSAQAGGVFFGVRYYLDRTGSVALYAFGGGERGARLVFKREF